MTSSVFDVMDVLFVKPFDWARKETDLATPLGNNDSWVVKDEVRCN